MDVCLWMGPVFGDTLKDVAWKRPTKVVVINQGIGGFGSQHFAALAASLGPRPLTAILKKNGIPNPDKVAIASFSAGHGLWEAILRSPDATRVNALLSSDSYFTDFAEVPKLGSLNFVQRAAQGRCLAVYTTSSNGGVTPPYPPGDEAFSKLVAKVSGVRPRPPPPGVPPPVDCVGKGLFTWANYRFTFSHADHANVLASKWCSATLAPYLAGELASPQAGSRVENAAWGGLLAAGVAAAAVKLYRAA